MSAILAHPDLIATGAGLVAFASVVLICKAVDDAMVWRARVKRRLNGR